MGGERARNGAAAKPMRIGRTRERNGARPTKVPASRERASRAVYDWLGRLPAVRVLHGWKGTSCMIGRWRCCCFFTVRG